MRVRSRFGKSLLLGLALTGASAGFGETRAVQLDLARQMETVAFVTNFIARVADVGYNTVVLYLEDRIRTKSYPYPTPEESYSPEEMRVVVEAASRRGVDLVPVISPFGHVDRFLRHPELRRFAEVKDGKGRFGSTPYMFCQEDPAAQAWMANYLAEVAAIFPGENFHFGFDEMDDLGFCPTCRALREKEGLGKLYMRGVRWAYDLSKRLGKRMWIWTSFFAFFPEELANVPPDVVLSVGNYAPDLDRVGYRNNFGGRIRRDYLSICRELGRTALVQPWRDVDNIRGITDYAVSRPHAGYLLTQWELAGEFHGWSYPRVLACARLWWGGVPAAGDAWLAAGVAAAFPTADETVRTAVGTVLADVDLTLEPLSFPASADVVTDRAKILGWKTALAAMKAAPSRPGEGTVPADPLGEAALLDDLVVRTELAILAAEARNAASRLLCPDRTVADVQASRRVIAAGMARWQALSARRLQQWKAWRPGAPSAQLVDFNRSYAAFAATATAVPDRAPESEWLLEVDVMMADAYGVPIWRIDGHFSDGWRPLADGYWKPRVGKAAYLPKTVVLSLATPPDALRIAYRGYGAGELCHVSLRNVRQRLVPARILSADGDVRDAANLLTDDFSTVRFGNPDCTAAMLNPDLAEKVSTLEVTLRPYGPCLKNMLEK